MTGRQISRAGCTGKEHPDTIGFDLRGEFSRYAAHITTDADAVAVLPRWEDSRGARGEVVLALGIGLPVLDALTGELLDVDVFVTSTPAPTDRTDLRPVPAPVAPAPAPATPRERGERLVTSASGGSKSMKEARIDLIPAGPLWELAVLYGRGQMKYPDDVAGAPNWKRGYPWSSSYSAMLRHGSLFWMGEDYDPEMAVKHMIAVAWHALNLAWFVENRPEFDDRPGKGPERYGPVGRTSAEFKAWGRRFSAGWPEAVTPENAPGASDDVSRTQDDYELP